MKPTYTRLQAPPVRTITLATKAKQVEAWLSALAESVPPCHAGLLAEIFWSHNPSSVPEVLRRQMFQILWPRLVATLQALADASRGGKDVNARVAMSEPALGLAVAAIEFVKPHILDWSERTPRLFSDNPLPGLLAGLMVLQRGVMNLCHTAYRQLPEGFWLDVHQSAQLMNALALAESADSAMSPLSLVSLYKAILLEALADPFHLSEQERQ